MGANYVYGVPVGYKALRYTNDLGSGPSTGIDNNGTCGTIDFNASWDNATYTDNGKVMPLSISKQSYIIYK